MQEIEHLIADMQDSIKGHAPTDRVVATQTAISALEGAKSETDLLRETVAELTKENATYKRRLEILEASLQAGELMNDERLLEASRIAFGFAMKKAGIDILVVDPVAMYTTFSPREVTMTPAAQGKIRYRLISKLKGKK